MAGEDYQDRYAAPPKPAWQRYGVPAVVGLFAIGGVAGGIVLVIPKKSPTPRPHIEQHITQIKLPPPPPPPPPPKVPPPPDKKQEQQKPVPSPQQAKVIPKAAPKAPTPPAALTTSITGPGAGSLAAGNGGGGDCVTDCGTGDGGGDAGAYYSSQMVNLVNEKLRNDPRLKTARYHGMVAFTIDRHGHPSNIQVVDFTGDEETRALIVQLIRQLSASEDFPADMADGQPWRVRLNAHAPG